jgi:hypothetical protein
VSTKYIPTLTVDKWPGWAFQPTPLRSGEASESESGNWVLERVGWPVHSDNGPDRRPAGECFDPGSRRDSPPGGAGAIGINWDGRRCVLAVEMANHEGQTSWNEFLEKLRERGLRGVQFVVSE